MYLWLCQQVSSRLNSMNYLLINNLSNQLICWCFIVLNYNWTLFWNPYWDWSYETRCETKAFMHDFTSHKTRLSCFGLIEFKVAGIYLSMKFTVLWWETRPMNIRGKRKYVYSSVLKYLMFFFFRNQSF